MASDWFLVPGVDDGTGTTIPKYTDSPHVSRYHPFILSQQSADAAVPLIANRLGVSESQVRANLPETLFLVRVFAQQSTLDNAASRSDVIRLAVEETVEALNRRFDASLTAVEWRDRLTDRRGEEKNWSPPDRSFEGVRHQRVRERVDEEAMAMHDAVSAAYYGASRFVWNGVDHGLLTKPEFNLIHAYAATHLPTKALHEANLALSDAGVITKIPEDEYRYTGGGDDPESSGETLPVTDHYQAAVDAKQRLGSEGFALDLTLSVPSVPGGELVV